MNDNKIETIRSPYNFVPLSDTVVFPGWADQVSHDVPFGDGVGDGISGKIDLEVTLQSDTYIKDSESDTFFKATFINENGETQKKYVIPGTSFKGMIRNVLEIATFGKLQKVNNDRYSIRDLNNSKYRDHLTKTISDGVFSAKSKAGWLTVIDNKWYIIPCEYARIEQEDLERYFLKNYSKKTNFGAEDEKSYKKGSTIEFKYNQIKGLEDVWFYPQSEKVHEHTKVKLSYKKIIYNENLKENVEHKENLYNENTKNNLSVEDRKKLKAGTIVFTGQPSKRVHGASGIKHMEFIFYKEACGNPIPVDDKKEDFIFVNSDSKKNPLPAWEYWTRDVKKDDAEMKKSEQEKGDGELKEDRRVPVFYLEDSNGDIKSFGLAMMYRLPYENSVVQTIAHTSTDHFSFDDYQKYKEKYKIEEEWKPDLSDLIFGYSNKETSLKGRVQFSHFISEKTVDEITIAGLKTTVLGGPKASYYPNYLEQPNLESSGRYKLFWDPDAKIRGWKRYPAQGIDASYPKPPTDNEAMNKTLIPLKAKADEDGVLFKGSLRFFNLRPVELGALLWTLTWGGEKYCQHNIGMGKALGLGRISVDITEKKNLETSEDIDSDVFIAKFKEYMNKELKFDWESSEQIFELKTMADIRNWDEERTTSYLTLNEHVDAKKKRLKLERYSEIIANDKDNVHSVKVETREDKMKQAEKEAKLAAALEDLPDELKGIFEMLSNLGSSEFKEKLKNLDDDVKRELEMLPLDKWKAGHRKVIEKLREKRQKKQ